MRILMLGRTGLMDVGGGDKIQVENTAKELRNLGLKVDVHLGMDFEPKNYDLVHIFQLDWIPPEPYFYAKKAKEAKIPVVLSPIHHKLDDVKKFDDEFVFDFRRVSKIIFKDQFKRDTFKNVYRSIFDNRILKPTFYSVIYGFKNLQRKTLEMVDKILVQTHVEERDLESVFDIKIKNKTYKVVNGVGRQFINNNKYNNPFDFENYILSVGRIEPRKNQLNIIKAVRKLREESNMDLKLVLVGRYVGLKHLEYSRHFKKEMESCDWITHIESIPYEKMPSYYHFAKVCVSASWFESTGLTSLEALYCGTNSVASGEQAAEYLGDYVSYCEPNDVESIKKAIDKEFRSDRPVMNEEMKVKYTWENAAKETLKVYNELLGL